MRVTSLQHGMEGPPRRLVEAAHEFEAQMMKQLLKPLISGDEEGSEGGYGGALTEFAGENLGRSLSESGGLGIARSIIGSLSRIRNDQPAVGEAGVEKNSGEFAQVKLEAVDKRAREDCVWRSATMLKR